MAMNNRILRPLAVPGVLDFAPGAAAAYSLRNLSSTYAGPVVTVRRSTDDAEADFTAAEVSDGTLAGWAGADGFVKQWWDQSGNARHATQATTTAQPQIVDSGVLVTEGGKAAVRFDGVDDFLSLAGINNASAWSVFYVARRQAAAKAMPVLGSSTDATVTYPAYEFTDNKTYSRNSVGYKQYADATVQQVMYTTISKSDSDFSQIDTFRNGGILIADLSASLAGGNTWDAIGKITTSEATGTMQEIVVYLFDQTALRQRIEGNLAWYY